MPWNNQGGGGPWGGGGGNTGGGGNGGGGNNNPWGQGPRGGGGGPQGGPPDFDDIFRRGQDRFRSALPPGGVSPGMIILVVLAFLAFWVYQAVYTVQPDELAIELRFGKPKEEVSEPGLHFHLWPIETVEKAVTAEKLISIGQNQGNGESLMLTGDQNLVRVAFSVAYQVADPRIYLFRMVDPDDTLRQVAESAMREVVGRRPAQDIFRDDRQGIADQVRDIIQGSIDTYGAGLAINAISIEDAAPPPSVADSFDEVQRAEQDEDRFVEEANRDSNQVLGRSRGEAAQIREEAAGYKARVVNEAEGESQRFISIYDEYAKAPEVTRRRIYLETMEGVFRDSNKTILGTEGGQGVVPYLPLNELQRRTPAQNNTPAAQGGNN